MVRLHLKQNRRIVENVLRDMKQVLGHGCGRSPQRISTMAG